jgi:glutathione synthase/RimK-type ligase-like ATP-grasp enzyme
MLRRDAELAPFLPQTAPLRSARGLLAALASSGGELFLKPDGGSQGRGAMHVRLEPDGGAVAVLGRTPGNAPFSRRFRDGSSFAEWLQRNVGQRPYLVQPYLALTDRTGAPYDIRCLVQKNGRGAWQLTGMAVRHGRPAGVTANLHGGGAALPATSFLAGEFGPEAAAIAADLKRLAVRVPETLEAQHGRLVELGIDFGVDRSGRIWLIEVNSKPGRAAFVRIGSPQTWRTAVESPLRYARFMSTPAETGSSDFAHTKCSGGPTP